MAPKARFHTARDPSRRHPPTVILERSEESRRGGLLEDDTGGFALRSNDVAFSKRRCGKAANEVAPAVQTMLPSANDVALRANMRLWRKIVASLREGGGFDAGKDGRSLRQQRYGILYNSKFFLRRSPSPDSVGSSLPEGAFLHKAHCLPFGQVKSTLCVKCLQCKREVPRAVPVAR